jgi:5-oxopent-3-ene-1,2,5-tricarboxylate decarboxylase/2-hydroxyhepta-2,4-diene-1,7-dioate isomerase
MKLARFAYNGQVHEAVFENEQLWVGTVAYDPAEVMWLPPVEPRGSTAIGVALGYAEHAAELKLDVPDDPILFHKMPHTFTGHKSKVTRPAVDYMHYEGELVVIMGRPCRKVSAAAALDYVWGYTIGNDFTVRDFVTNYYRPPVKAKGFDGFGPLGPVMVTADELDPTNLNIKTYLNGAVKQADNSKNLRHSVAQLIEYISDFMTLQRGDTIWTGTPEGLAHLKAGDLVRVEIEGIGELENEIVG